MSTINWQKEVEKRKDELIATTQRFLQIDSVLDPDTAGEGAPFGKGVQAALQFALQTCEDAGMTIRNIDGYAGHAEFGQGDECIGVLSHVDVVPPGDGWTIPPFAADIIEGKIMARGALDDKGPAMAAIFAAKMIKELELPLQKRIRLIFGTDEESGWECVKRYFESEEMPTMGFTPDADFPLIYAEKGLTHLVLRQTNENFEQLMNQSPLKVSQEGTTQLLSFHAGMRVNMVPEMAEAELACPPEQVAAWTEAYQIYLEKEQRRGHITQTDTGVVFSLQGVSVHGMDPAKGVNAGAYLAQFLQKCDLDVRGRAFVDFIATYLFEQHDGEAFGINADDQEMGSLTLNPGIFHYVAGEDVRFDLNIRYPHSILFEQWKRRLEQVAAEHGYLLEIITHKKPHRVDPAHPLVTTLQRVYTEQTGEKAELLAIGGGTYGRALDVGVAFGPLFPGRQDTAHQRDEYLLVEDLLKATAIYAQAIFELAKN
ncbi:dipeptidase PepV [Brevibacillus sp. VP]|uniref:dipeptidase PepV n=1 Tax=unclassified Brevibacillus TaxID=2684853 RepID=UPI000E2FAAE6|nr:dipeptidase PepV [Brevibacillus sp. VP]RFB32211.1 dipeptidase PepV [Brevibacillus sp. VP]